MNIIKTELDNFNLYLSESINNDSYSVSKEINNFIFAEAKRIRPILVFLFAKSLNLDIDEKIYALACAVEIIHSATLIHDDVVDSAVLRRGRPSVNKTLGNNISVLTGDMLLSFAIEKLVFLNNFKVINIFINALKLMCNGEINQYLSLNEIPDFQEYIKKSKNKTAELFSAVLESLCVIADIKEQQNIVNFALNFGIAFQLKDDYMNIYGNDKSKPLFNDIYAGIYTLPLIILSDKTDDFKKLTKEKIIAELINSVEIKEKTLDIIRQYSIKAIASIEFMRDNCYKEKIIEITKKLYKVV